MMDVFGTKSRVRTVGISLAAMIVASLSSTLHAQTTPPADEASVEGLQEITVTAERRSSNLQRTPVAVAVISNTQLAAAGINTVQDIKIAAPGVEVQSNNGYALPIIRGVGTKATGAGIETPIAVYVDGVYYATPVSSLFSFNNIAQVEILKGPQGTLFGRNSTGGLIQVTTKDPTQELTGQANLSYGNYQTLRGAAYLAGGLSENVAADISVQGVTMGKGYGKNLANGKDVYKIDRDISLRSKWLFTFGDRTEVRVIGDYTTAKNSMSTQSVPAGAVVPPTGLVSPSADWDTNLDTQPLIKYRAGGLSMRIDHELESVKVSSITAYRKSSFRNLFDFDFSPLTRRSVYIIQHDKQFSQELQLLSTGSGPISWTAGAYYFNADSEYDPITFNFTDGTYPAGNIRNTVIANQKTDSISAFGQVTAAVTDRLKLTGGLRYTSEKRSLPSTAFFTNPAGVNTITVPQRTLSNRFKKLTWRAAADYQFSNEVFGYASFNRGFKSGGFNPSGLALPPFKPEVLDAYEAGLKTTLFDRRLRFNTAAYYYDYQNVQVQRVVDGANGVFNGAKAEIYGFDTDITFQATPELLLTVGYQYAHGRYKEFPGSVVAIPRAAGGYTLGVGDVSGNHTVLTPKSSLSTTAAYTVELGSGKLNLTGNYYYNSGYFAEPDNVIFDKAYSLFNASITYTMDNGVSFGVFGNNLSNEKVANTHGVSATGGGLGVERISLAPPRTYGVTVGTKF